MQRSLKLKTLKWGDHHYPREPGVIRAQRAGLAEEASDGMWEALPGPEDGRWGGIRAASRSQNAPRKEHNPEDNLNLTQWASLGYQTLDW